MSNKVIKFGQFLAEAEREKPKDPKLLDMNRVEEGHEEYRPEYVYALSPVMPAAVALELDRLGKEYGEHTNIPEKEMLGLVRTLFPPMVLGRLLEVHGLDMEQLGQLFEQTFMLYADELGVNLPAAQEGNAESRTKAPAEERVPLTLSSNGDSSKLTSNESITLTSPLNGTAGKVTHRPYPGVDSDASLMAWGRNPSWYSPSNHAASPIDTATAAARK